MRTKGNLNSTKWPDLTYLLRRCLLQEEVWCLTLRSSHLNSFWILLKSVLTENRDSAADTNKCQNFREVWWEKNWSIESASWVFVLKCLQNNYARVFQKNDEYFLFSLPSTLLSVSRFAWGTILSVSFSSEKLQFIALDDSGDKLD